jgi:alpha-D-ribose 1-methylphosphonate 5-triphosphate synthase subunit PhnL
MTGKLMQILLEVRNLSKQFVVHHLHREVPAFNHLSFDVREGEFVLVAGPNGVGKSTLLRCLYRTYLPTAGEAIYHSRHGAIDLVRAADVDIVKLRNEEIGHVTQFLRARPRISAIDWVAEPLMAAGTPREASRDAAAEWLHDFGLKRELWEAYPTTFSGGEQQKVNLARALIAPRRLILLDEPTASLDVQARAALVARLASLKRAGVALIGVFHHAEDLASLVNREVRLSAGADVPAMGIDHDADLAAERMNGYVAQ